MFQKELMFQKEAGRGEGGGALAETLINIESPVVSAMMASETLIKAEFWGAGRDEQDPKS